MGATEWPFLTPFTMTPVRAIVKGINNEALTHNNAVDKQLRRGVHRSTTELETAIRNYIQHQNKNPKPFVWHKTANQILDSDGRSLL